LEKAALGRAEIRMLGHWCLNSGGILNDSPINDGNFRALLRFCVEAGDHSLGEHLANSSTVARYISSIIQNELIDLCGEIIRKNSA
jgi:hypothetical protein